MEIIERPQEYRAVFFGGGETMDNVFNVFTGSFIRMMKGLMEDNFSFMKGVYFRYQMFNIIWCLNNCQRPLKKPEKSNIISSGFRQLLPEENNCETILIITSSSYGAIVAAQSACYLAEENISKKYYLNPFHLALGTTNISKESPLYHRLLDYQKRGIIGTIIFDELQDEGDSVNGTGGRTRIEAWRNAFGLILPFLSFRFKGPSFLNIDPEKGHLHRKRSQTVQKAIDFIDTIFIKKNIAGEVYKSRALKVIAANKL